MDLLEFSLFLEKTLAALHGGHDAWLEQSTREKAAVAIALNRTDWLVEMGFGMDDAMYHAGAQWCAMLPAVIQALELDDLTEEKRQREAESCERDLRDAMVRADATAQASISRYLIALLGADRQRYAEAVARAEGAAAVMRARAGR